MITPFSCQVARTGKHHGVREDLTSPVKLPDRASTAQRNLRLHAGNRVDAARKVLAGVSSGSADVGEAVRKQVAYTDQETW